MKWIDLPPIWLFLCLLLAWIIPLRFAPGGLVYLGGALLLVGVVLTLLAVVAFRKARTTIIPREAPEALITDGIFAYSRNPIYLADVLFLAGASLIMGSLVGLLLVPAFTLMLRYRFIQGEEATLRTAYGAAFEAYSEKVRRWI